MERPRALVVDDDEPIRTLLAKLIGNEDILVDTARDGAEAIERLDRNGYRVVLLDLMMPKVDGYTVLRHIQENCPEKLGHTIVATAVPSQDVAARVPPGVFRVHAKPFDVHALLADVHAAAR